MSKETKTIEGLKGKITISRRHHSRDDDRDIYISIIEDESSCRVVEACMSLKDFALALTGMSHTACEIDIYEAPYGKKRIFKVEPSVKFKKRPEDLTKKQLDKILAPFEIDGWKAERYFNTQHQVRHVADGYEVRVTLYKFVDPEDVDKYQEE